MSQPIAFVAGDAGTDLVVTLLEPDGTAFDLTGATSISLEGRLVGGETTISLPGVIFGTATNGQVAVENVGTAYTPAAARPRATFECRVKWTQSAEQFWSLGSFLISIVKFP